MTTMATTTPTPTPTTSNNARPQDDNDVEAATATPVVVHAIHVGGAAAEPRPLGEPITLMACDDQEAKQQEQQRQQQQQQGGQWDTSIMVLTIVYCVLIIMLFVGPRLLDSDNTLDDFVYGLAIVFLGLLAALIIAIVTASLTGCRWSRLSGLSKATGLFPIISFCILVLVIAILIRLENNDNNNDDTGSSDEVFCSNYVTDCKNQTEIAKNGY